MLEADLAHLEGDVDLAALSTVGGRAILSARDDIQRPRERLLGESTEITFEFQRGAGVAQSELDVARSQGAATILQFGLIEADEGGFLADQEVEARS